MPNTEPSGKLGALLAATPDLRRLATVRFAGQFGDGMFQAALSGAILFNPERETDPFAVAAGFAVLLLPYSLLGPFAGALLDRWDRRLVLTFANVLRSILIATTAGALLLGADDGTLLLLALAVIGVSRFVMAGISAALPLVVAPKWLVTTNSVLATVASGIAGVGAAAGVAVIAVIGEGDAGSAAAVLASASGSVVAGILAVRFGPRVLGPVGAQSRGTLGAIAAGLRTGVRAVWQAPGVTTAMIGIGAHRIVFGANTLIMVLILRESTDGVGGLVGFGLAIAATASGMLTAALVAPILIPLLGRSRTVTAGVAFALVVQIGLVATLNVQLMLIGAFALGLAGQTIKLTGDAAMQLDIDDTRRGQVFALQDTVFNITFVLSIVVAASLVPPDGRSVPVVLGVAGWYVLALLAITANSRRAR